MNLKQLLEGAATRYGTKTVIASGEHRLSYTELDETSNKIANALLKMGIRKGDRVAILLGSSPEFVTIYFGIVKIGAVAVPLDTKYKLTELTALFNNCEPKVLLTEGLCLEAIAPALPRLNFIEQVIDVSPKGKQQFLSYQEIMATSSAQRVEVEIQPQDLAHIAYTSGPSLRPRGAMLTHQSLATEAAISAAGFQQTDKDKVMLFALPLHHAFGLVVIFLTSVYKGSTVVMLPGFSISGLLDFIDAEKPTMFMGVPFIYALLNNTAEETGVKHNLSSLRFCGSAGATLPVDVVKKFKKYYGLTIVDLWGQTEASAHVTCQSLSGARLGSVGKALSGWELKIVDEQGHELPSNQPGEIIVRGPIMAGYYKHPEATAEVMRRGWLHTGDLGKLDEEGNVFLTGRKKNMIIAKGQNIHPTDIEDLLCSHPKVAGVVVIGVPDEVRGESVRALIRLKPGEVATEQEIKRFCLEHLANYKVPKEIIFTDSLSETSAGKIT